MNLQDLKQKVEELNDGSSYTEAADLAAKVLGITMEITSTRFGSMDWDKDGSKRYIQTIKLSRDKEDYTFDFGNSIAKSCKKVKLIDTMKDDDIIEVYAGMYSTKNSISGGKNFCIKLSDTIDTNADLLQSMAEEVRDDFNRSVDEHNTKMKKSNKYNADLVNKMRIDEASRCVSNAIARKLKELETTEEYSKEEGREPIPTPTFYDILTCLTKYDPGSFENFCGDFGYDEDSRSAERTYKAVVKEYKAMARLFSEEELEVLQCIN